MRRTLLSERQSRFRRLVTPLPDSEPYVNRRPVNVPQRFDRRTVLDVLDPLLPTRARGRVQPRDIDDSPLCLQPTNGPRFVTDLQRPCSPPSKW